MKKTTLGIVALTAISLATIAQAQPEPNKGTAVGAVVGGVAGGQLLIKQRVHLQEQFQVP